MSQPVTAIFHPVPHFNLAETLECGQCFRWNPSPEGGYAGVVGRLAVRLEQTGETLQIHGITQGEFAQEILPYLSLEEDYGAIKAHLSTDPILKKAIAYAPGIRVLHQDGWEALCSFIISQNNNIPRIKGIVERLCQQLGEPLAPGIYAFPTPQRLAACTLPDLEPLRSGFRAKYLLDAATKIADGTVHLDWLATMPLEQAAQHLQLISGVGPKVADCALLYGFGRTECFPTDVWIRRVVDKLYPTGLPACATPYRGIAQQYLFHYARTCPEALSDTLGHARTRK